MSEAVLDKTEVTPPEDVALTTPESTPESTPAPENNEDDAALDAILEGLGSSDAETGTDDGKGASTNELVPPATKPLTPEEAREQGRRDRDAEIATQQTSAERQRYLDGLNNVVQDVPLKLTALAEKYAMAPTDVTELYTQFNRLNGAYKPLYDHSVSQREPQIRGQAYQEAEAEVSKLLLTTISEELGESALKAIQTAAPKTWPDLAKAITKEARKGYVAKEEVSKGQKALLKKLEGPLAERGITLAQITGSTGPQTPAATGGSNTNTTQALDRAYGNNQIDAATYKARYKALTGREP